MVRSASMAVITLAFPRTAFRSPPQGSGFLVPPADGRVIKAATFSSTKWGWYADAAPATVVVRLSVGRLDEEADLQRDDAELVEVALADLTDAIGVTDPPVDARVSRWGGGLPQYAVGHLGRVQRVRAAVAAHPGLAVCGATYDGVGIPACVASAEERGGPGAATMGDVTPTAPTGRPAAKPKARDLNEVIRYTMWSVFKVARPLPDDRAGVAAEVEALFEQLAAKDLTVRGTYDVAGLRADADLMIWWHAPSSDDLQEAYNRFRRTTVGAACEPVWSVMALHRPAEFNKSHVPAFLADEAPGDYVCVYPFVRSYDWYLLPDEERRAMLAEHGQQARTFPDVRANTVASFALGDYEWVLAFEADELHRIVDLMRELRASRARMHVREEVPFYTGRRKPVAELVAALP